MNLSPDLDRVVAVLVQIALRSVVQTSDVDQGDRNADGGVLPSVD